MRKVSHGLFGDRVHECIDYIQMAFETILENFGEGIGVCRIMAL